MELQIFQNAEFGSVRSTMIGGEPFFVGKDVAEILGYADPNEAIAMHVDEDDKLNDKTASSLGRFCILTREEHDRMKHPVTDSTAGDFRILAREVVMGYASVPPPLFLDILHPRARGGYGS